MNVKEEQICRLCLKVVENDFEIIDETARHMFEGLLLKVNLNISKNPIMCRRCAEIAAKCFNFKSACIDTENRIFSCFVHKNKAISQLDDIYKGGTETVDKFICRFCLKHLSESNFVLLDTLLKDVTLADMLQMLMPKMDINVIKNFSICTSCREDLQCYIKFLNKCFDVENKITNYIQEVTVQVKLSEVLRFSLTNILKLDYTQMSAIKQEKDISDDTYTDKLIKTEEIFEIKYEELNFNDTVCKISSDMPVYKLNTSCESNNKLGESQDQKALIDNSSFTPTTADYTEYMCDKINYCFIKCDRPSNNHTIHKGEVNKEMNQTINPENISEVQLFKCSKCTYQTSHKRGLKNHMFIHKDNTEMYKCSMCTFETNFKGSLKRHLSIHKDITEVEMYKCSMCTYETKQKSNLKTHRLIHKDITEVEMYKCSMCMFETKQKGSLKRHMLIHKDISEVEMYKCSMCTYETKQKGYLKKHMSIHKTITKVEIYTCSMCTYVTKQKGYLKRHMLIHKMERYKCSMCTYETNNKSSLKRHILIHKDITEVEIYKCAMCTFQAKHKGYLKKHMLIHKDIKEVKMYKCSVCTFKTKHKNSLKQHIALIHRDNPGMETYRCSICSFQANRKDHLKIHMLTHKNNTQIEMYKCSLYKCSMCTYETKRKSSLVRHVLIHKDITEIEMYKCSVCSYKTKYRDKFKRHTSIHEDVIMVAN